MTKEMIAKHFGKTWVEFMTGFAGNGGFTEIFAKLKEDKAGDLPIYPEQTDLFKCFRLTPLDNLKVVILGVDPYPKEGYANGLAFGHATNLKHSTSLNCIIDTIEKDAYNGLFLNKPNFDTTLESWAKQGVLLFNTSLTVKDGVAGSHSELWKPFTEYVCNTLGTISKNLIWLSWGSQTHNFTKDINPFDHFIFTSEHPTKAAKEKRDWKCSHFSLTNSCIVKNKLGTKIEW